MRLHQTPACMYIHVSARHSGERERQTDLVGGSELHASEGTAVDPGQQAVVRLRQHCIGHRHGQRVMY